MSEQLREEPQQGRPGTAAAGALAASSADQAAAAPATPKGHALRIYRRILDFIVTALIFVMVLTLLGALGGLLIDFAAATGAFLGDLSVHRLAHGVVDALDRELVIDVLSVFVLIELFRSFTDYLEFHRVRLRVMAEVGIAFILREIFIGLYDRQMQWPEILALAALLGVLVMARLAAVAFHPADGGSD
jgi:uncharacterized membrane protein (DUF373 family)